MTDSPLLQRVLAGIVALCLVAGVGIALARGGDDADAPSSVAATRTETTGPETTVGADSAPVESTPSAGDAVTTTAPAPKAGGASTPSTAAGGATATTAVQAGASGATGPAEAADAGTPTDPGNVIPPAPGTYRYDTTVNGEKKETSTVVEDVSRSASETKQVITIETEQFKIRNDVLWQPDKVLVPKSAILIGQSSADCDWTPDMIQAVLPMKEGVNWKNDTSCTASFNNVPVTLKRKTDSTVKGLERLRIGGEIVDVWRIEGTEHTEFAGPQGGGTSDTTATTWFSPKHGMIVKTVSKSTSKDTQGQTTTADVTSELKSLKPS